MTIATGTKLGRYEIRSKLGEGGMGEVYLAQDTQLDRRVAIKLLPPETISDEHARKRLVREARAAATLDHPHICSVYEVGEADGRSFIVMHSAGISREKRASGAGSCVRIAEAVAAELWLANGCWPLSIS